MGAVAILVGGKFVLYTGFFYLLSRILDIGVPLDALKAGFHRSWMGAASSMVCLMAFMMVHMAGVSAEANQVIGTSLIWLLRLALWTWVATQVYRVTRWRKGKLAVVVAAGLALNLGIDLALLQLEKRELFMPSLGTWQLRLC
jgi:hypothetical protein